MGTREEGDGVRSAIRGLLEKDRAAGELKDLTAYQKLFAGFPDTVAEEYGAFAKETSGAGQAITSGPPAPMTVVGPGAAAPAPPDLGGEADHIGPYRIVRELGRGGMGVVYEAQDTRIGRRVALKILSPQFASSTHLRLRFQREAELASKLDHPHVCTVYEAGEDDGAPFLAMRYVEGRPLSDLVASTRERLRTTGVVHVPEKFGVERPEKSKSGEMRLDLDRALLLFEKAARALHYAHEKGLIHRDIKPHNIMVTDEGEPVLLDFGLAREEAGEGHQLTQTGSLMGTPAYMSPEQLMAQRIQLDRRTDVFSLGVSLYECLTLKLPFEAPTVDRLYQKILATDPEDPRRLNRDLPEDLKVVLETVLEKDRDRRYQSAEDLAEELRRVREHEPIHARPVGPLGRLARWSQRSPGMATAVSALFLSLTGGLALSLNFLKAVRMQRDEKEMALQDARTQRDAKAGALAVARKERDEKEVERKRAEEERQRAEKEKEEKSRALEESRERLTTARALGLVNASRLQAEKDPILALLLAREAAGMRPGKEVLDNLRDRVVGNMERGRLEIGQKYGMDLHPAGDRFLTEDGHLYDLEGRVSSGPLYHSVRQPGKEVAFGVSSARFSPDGMRILTLARDNTARLWSLEGKELACLRGHSEIIEAAAFSPDGRLVATGSQDGTARIFESSGKEVAVLRGHGKGVTSVTFDPAGQRVLTTSQDGTARLWSLAGEPLMTLEGHKGPVTCGAFSPGGMVVATGGQDRTARLWGTDGKPVRALEHLGPVRIVRFDWGGMALLTVDFRPTLWVLKTGAATQFACPSEVNTVEVVGVPAFSLGGMGDWRLLAALEDGTARVWDFSGREVAVLRHEGTRCMGARFLPGNRRVLTIGHDSTARIWDLGAPEYAVLTGHGSGLYTAFFSEDGRRILTASSDRTARIWNADGEPVAVLKGHGNQVYGARFLPGSDRVLTISADDTVRLWDGEGAEKAAFRIGTKGGHWLQVAPDGKGFLAGSRLWSLEGGPPVDLDGERGSFSPAGDEVLVVHGPEARVLGLDGKARLTLTDPLAGAPRGNRQLLDARFTPDGDRILTLSNFGVTVWDREGKAVATIDAGADGFQGMLEFLDGGTRFCVQSQSSRTFRIFDLEGRAVAAIPTHGQRAVSQAVSRAGDLLALGMEDGTIGLWDSRGRALATCRDPEKAMGNLAFSPDGRFLVMASSSASGVARIWTVRTEDLLRLAAERSPRELTEGELEVHEDLLGDASRARLEGIREKRRAEEARQRRASAAREAVERLRRPEDRFADLEARVRSDPSLEGDARAAALEVLPGFRGAFAKREEEEARRRQEAARKARPLNEKAWKIVVREDAGEEEAREGLRLAEQARDIAPEDPGVLNTLGVARFRCGRFEEALGTLEKSGALHAASSTPWAEAYDLAFQARCLHRLSKTGEGQKRLARAMELFKDPAAAPIYELEQVLAAAAAELGRPMK